MKHFKFLIVLYIQSGICFADTDLTGEIAPKWALKSFDGDYIFLNDYVAPAGEDLRGDKKKQRSVIVQTFFASWCGNCISEISELHQISKSFEAKNIEFFIIDLTEYTRRSADPEYRQAKNGADYLDDLGFNRIPVLMDDDGITAMSYGFDIELGIILPRLLVIDKYQQVRFDKTGACSKCFDDELIPLLDELIKE